MKWKRGNGPVDIEDLLAGKEAERNVGNDGPCIINRRIKKGEKDFIDTIAGVILNIRFPLTLFRYLSIESVSIIALCFFLHARRRRRACLSVCLSVCLCEFANRQ